MKKPKKLGREDIPAFDASTYPPSERRRAILAKAAADTQYDTGKITKAARDKIANEATSVIYKV